MKYDGKPVTLTPEAEEVASFFAALLESDHGKNPTFQKNFFSDFQEVLAKNPKVTNQTPSTPYAHPYSFS
jgi:DNA topoisomerase-1